ncbi:hypothetical protein [Xenorhabdus sp. IM139775]|uniref:hypothetical protein n=1 Tax=Xenorhabdus sp. IM139775 TaxID=3025876 RepID=UPI002358F268|nr:hypothetical protein [Xenorhabdus sp. IM139775]MDC9595122.1 hypothetical protein [Xenorhabdus sp. IM139775]
MQNRSPAACERRRGAACRLSAARTRRTAARRPASRATFARCRKGNASQNQAVESTRVSTGAILHYSKRAQWPESAHRGSGKKIFTPTGKTVSLTSCY